MDPDVQWRQVRAGNGPHHSAEMYANFAVSHSLHSLSAFINGYLPVVALLGLIIVLPFIFQGIAMGYEKRKTFSDVQGSILGRYFYFQLANIYITVTAGSLWRSLAGIVDHPSSALELLGESLPTMVGYFVSLLITKIFAGLPIVVLRVGALSRMVFLKTFFLDDKLSQREIDKIYRPENVMYGWEVSQHEKRQMDFEGWKGDSSLTSSLLDPLGRSIRLSFWSLLSVSPTHASPLSFYHSRLPSLWLHLWCTRSSFSMSIHPFTKVVALCFPLRAIELCLVSFAASARCGAT
jgi:hypothetical protein